MTTDFLAYWKPSTLDYVMEKAGDVQLHAASAQFERVNPGDTVWLVTVRAGRLHLITGITVEHRTGQIGAAKLLGVSPESLWKSEYHIVADEHMAREICDLDIRHVAPQLRFISASGNSCLTIREDGTVNAQQLQTMRIMTAESAELLSTMLQPVTIS